VAKVAGVEKEHVLLEIAPNVKVKFEIAHISKRLDKAEKAEAA
jgi:preprotein translocase subunit YajC